MMHTRVISQFILSIVTVAAAAAQGARADLHSPVMVRAAEASTALITIWR